ncbi:hypothetical protein BCR35DRAFT_54208 [Leucosporidium creatinivorum]|uniref:Uncharacterized protein n=1 Tax=Leucosporidium creatinivorum TaxID=106004 RepID=A0A1Y2FN33_9BASI|nr:hypothetical protein BCR35DRAFT_54208 [Leucosporidium creatinivorum]
MESLGRLSDTLPSEAAEKELQASFRSAALALTGLFKQGKKATNQAYIAGKREALQDVLEFLQTSLDHPSQPAQGPLNVARLIDYICARQETLKAEEEGDDEDDSAGAPNASTSAASRTAPPPSPSTRQSFPSPTRPPAPSAPITRPSSAALHPHNPIASTSSSAPSSPAFTRLSPSSFARPLPLPSHAPFPFTAPSSPSPAPPPTPLSRSTPPPEVSPLVR